MFVPNAGSRKPMRRLKGFSAINRGEKEPLNTKLNYVHESKSTVVGGGPV